MSDGVFSDRHSIPTPGDGQDVSADGVTQAVSIADPSDVNWGDAIQTILLDDDFLDGKLVASGNLASRSTAGTDAPKLFVVTDAGANDDGVYLTFNDDSAWHDAVYHSVRNGTGNTIPIESPADWLREGYIAGVAPGYQVVEDPRDHATGDVAIQAVHDDLADNLGNADYGKVYIPPTDPDGSRLEIASTVTFDGNSSSRFQTVVPQGWHHSTAGGGVDVTIDDGSPAFIVRDSIGPVEWGGIHCEGAVANNDASGTEDAADAEVLYLENIQRQHVTDMSARSMGKATSRGLYTFGSRVFNSVFSFFSHTVPGDGTSLPNSTLVDMRDPAGTGNPGELFLTGFSQYSPPSEPTDQSVVLDDSTDNIFLSGCRFEGSGANGNPMIEVRGGCHLVVGADNQFDRIEPPSGGGTTDHIETTASGARIHISDAVAFGPNDTGGNHVTLADGTLGYVGAFSGNDSVGAAGGVDIALGAAGGPNRLVVPYPEAMNNGVSYPSGPWNGPRYPDGYQRYREGSDSVAAGGSVTLNAFMDGQVSMRYLEITNNNSGEPELFPVWSWDTGNGNQALKVIENGGSVGADFDWEAVRLA